MKCSHPRLAAFLVLALLGGCIGVSQTRRDSTSTASGAAGAVKSCPKGVRVADDGDMDDFEDGNTQLTKMAGRDGYWWTKKDNFGSTVTMLPDDGGAGGSEVAMHFTGITTSGSGDDNWGAGVGVNFVSQSLLYDASNPLALSLEPTPKSPATTPPSTPASGSRPRPGLSPRARYASRSATSTPIRMPRSAPRAGTTSAPT